jgi:hypothetical protein
MDARLDVAVCLALLFFQAREAALIWRGSCELEISVIAPGAIRVQLGGARLAPQGGRVGPAILRFGIEFIVGRALDDPVRPDFSLIDADRARAAIGPKHSYSELVPADSALIDISDHSPFRSCVSGFAPDSHAILLQNERDVQSGALADYKILGHFPLLAGGGRHRCSEDGSTDRYRNGQYKTRVAEADYPFGPRCQSLLQHEATIPQRMTPETQHVFAREYGRSFFSQQRPLTPGTPGLTNE